MKYPLFLKKIVHNARYASKRRGTPDFIQVDWSRSLNNFGDVLNPFILGHLSSKTVLNVNAKYCNTEHLLAIGSVLDRATELSVVWGSGFISSKSKFSGPPKSVHAVRGPLTRDKLIEQGVPCPEVYGDPALLLPRYYKPDKEPKYELGILPHYIDKKTRLLSKLPPEVKLIDIQNEDPLKVIDQMCECKHIATSSLHGLIVSDAYRIPSVWIRLTDKISGGSFKYRDYFASIGAPAVDAFPMNTNIEPLDLIPKCQLRDLNIDLDKLVDHFPKSYS
jgi:pyruvyltransferase